MAGAIEVRLLGHSVEHRFLPSSELLRRTRLFDASVSGRVRIGKWWFDPVSLAV